MSSKLIKYLFLFILIIFLLSCSGEPPELHEIWSQLILLDDERNENPVETLSVFFHGEDKDGEEDLDQLYLINDENFSMWNIPSDLWITYVEEEITWYGFNGFRAAGDGIFSEGNYRVLLIDRGGERAEKIFYLRNRIPDKQDLILPEIQYDNESIKIISDFPKFEIWFYDRDDILIERSKELSAGNYLWNQISRNIVRRSFSFSVYSEPETGSWGVIAGPYMFNN